MTRLANGVEREQVKARLAEVNAELQAVREARRKSADYYDRIAERLRDEQARLNAKVYAA